VYEPRREKVGERARARSRQKMVSCLASLARKEMDVQI
jgi:hypothetical protein